MPEIVSSRSVPCPPLETDPGLSFVRLFLKGVRRKKTCTVTSRHVTIRYVQRFPLYLAKKSHVAEGSAPRPRPLPNPSPPNRRETRSESSNHHPNDWWKIFRVHVDSNHLYLIVFTYVIMKDLKRETRKERGIDVSRKKLPSFFFSFRNTKDVCLLQKA